MVGRGLWWWRASLSPQDSTSSSLERKSLALPGPLRCGVGTAGGGRGEAIVLFFFYQLCYSPMLHVMSDYAPPYSDYAPICSNYALHYSTFKT